MQFDDSSLLCLSIRICEAYKVAIEIEIEIKISIKIQNMDNSVVFKFVQKKNNNNKAHCGNHTVWIEAAENGYACCLH